MQENALAPKVETHLAELLNEIMDLVEQKDWLKCFERARTLLHLSSLPLPLFEQLTRHIITLVNSDRAQLVPQHKKKALLYEALKKASAAPEFSMIQHACCINLANFLTPFCWVENNPEEPVEVLRLLLQAWRLAQKQHLDVMPELSHLRHFETLWIAHICQPVLLARCYHALQNEEVEFEKLFEAIGLLSQRLMLQSEWEKARLLYATLLEYVHQLKNKYAPVQGLDEARLIEGLAQIARRQKNEAVFDAGLSDGEHYRTQLATLRREVDHHYTTGKSITELQAIITEGYQQLITHMLQDALALLGPAPCRFAFVAFGSYSRKEMLPYSDLEFALLVESINEPIRAYFRALLKLFIFKVESLGESNPENYLGFHLDAGIQPIKDDRFFNLPEVMAQNIFNKEKFNPEIYSVQAFSLLKPPNLIYGDKNLVEAFHAELQRQLEIPAAIDSEKDNANSLVYQAWALRQLAQNLVAFEKGRVITLNCMALKDNFSNPLTHFAMILGVYYNLPAINTIAILDQLAQKEILAPNFTQLYQRVLQAINALRLHLQLYYQEPEDTVAWPGRLPAAMPLSKPIYVVNETEQQLLLTAEYSLLRPLVQSLRELLRTGNLPPAHNPWQVGMDALMLIPALPKDMHAWLKELPLFSSCVPLHMMNTVPQEGLLQESEVQAMQALHHWLHYDKTHLTLQYHRDFYQFLSQHAHVEPLRQYYLKFLMAIQSPLVAELANMPNPSGYRQSERLAYERLNHDLMAITMEKRDTNEDMEVFVVWPDTADQLCERQLRPELIKVLLDPSTGKLQHHYKNSRHDVVNLHGENYALHVKALPDQPMMDYAIDLLNRRLIGHGSPANLLARLTVKMKNQASEVTYPVLVSQTLGQTNLRDVLKEAKSAFTMDHRHYSELVLVALLTGSGDGASRNYVLHTAETSQTLSCVDNEQQFVEPVIKEVSRSGFNKVQYRNILFCLDQADYPLDRTALTAFAQQKNIYNLVSHWVRDIQSRESVYLKLYGSLEERQQLYLGSRDDRFSPYFRIREGVLAELLINLNYLQNVIHSAFEEEKQLPSALDLITQINTRLGHYYNKAFRSYRDPEKRFKAATDAPQNSVSSSLAIKTSLGIVPTFQQMEGENPYSLKEAQKELWALLDFKPDFSKLVDNQGKPDEARQRIMLKLLAIRPHQELSLSHCTVLDDELLEFVLSKSKELKVLDLRACPQLTSRSVLYLAKRHRSLQKLYLSDNPGLTVIEDGSLFKSPLDWPNLKELRLSRCNNLTVLRIKALGLATFKCSHCPKLQIKEIVAPELNKEPHLIAPAITDKLTNNNSAGEDKHTAFAGNAAYDHLMKFYLLGDSDVGIGQIILRFQDDSFTPMHITTIGTDFKIRTVMFNGRRIKLQIWDAGSLYGFKTITTAYYRDYRGATGIMLVYDVTNSRSFSNIEHWLTNIRQHVSEEVSIILVGSRCDQVDKKVIDRSQGLALANSKGLPFFEVSAKNSINIDEAFLCLIKMVAARKLQIKEIVAPELNKEPRLIAPAITDKLTNNNSAGEDKHTALAGNAAYDYLMNFLLVGDSDVGKGQIILRFQDDSFTPSYITTIGIEFKIRTVMLNGKRIKLQIQDAGAQERFKTITTAYYRKAMGIMLVYDVTNSRSFSNIEHWLTNIRQHASEEVSIILVGSRCDQVDEKVIDRSRGLAFANSQGFPFFEVSAKNSINIDEAFLCLIEMVAARLHVRKTGSEKKTEKPHHLSEWISQESSLSNAKQFTPLGERAKKDGLSKYPGSLFFNRKAQIAEANLNPDTTEMKKADFAQNKK